VYEAGIKLEDSPALRKGLQEVQDAKAREGSAAGAGLGKIFSDPNILGKLAANPRTQKHLADPSFVQKIQLIQQNPALADSAFQDPRMIDAMGVLMGIDIQGFTRPEGSDEMPPGVSQTSPSSPPQSPPPQRKPTPQASKPKPAPEPEDVVMGGDDADDKRAKEEALAQKAKGASHYKAREFTEAAACYARAWELWPKDVTFLTNLGAVYYENGQYDECIETCEKAVEEGRGIRADYKLLAKALARTGTAYSAKGDLASAKKYYGKSLSEHRDASVLAKLQQTEKAIAETEKQAYIDPAKSAVAREEGNTVFKAGDFAGAVKLYTESIKRDPSDARGYNNRAAAYMKLVAFPEALKDVEEALKVDPNFVKAYIRKASIQHAMRKYTQALESLAMASSVDTQHAHTAEINGQEMKTQQAIYAERSTETEEQTLERAMKDPEVAQIMTDPVMQQILQQAQGNPGALQDHMKNPGVREKIMKLVNAGVIKTR